MRPVHRAAFHRDCGKDDERGVEPQVFAADEEHRRECRAHKEAPHNNDAAWPEPIEDEGQNDLRQPLVIRKIRKPLARVRERIDVNEGSSRPDDPPRRHVPEEIRIENLEGAEPINEENDKKSRDGINGSPRSIREHARKDTADASYIPHPLLHLLLSLQAMVFGFLCRRTEFDLY